MPFPTVTICNENGLDSGEYTRAVLNGLQFDGVDETGGRIYKNFEAFLAEVGGNW